jgi:hypothetical protein
MFERFRRDSREVVTLGIELGWARAAVDEETRLAR